MRNLLTLGKIYLESGQAGPAIDIYSRALSLIPDDATIYAGLAQAYQKQENLEQAIATFEKGIEVDKNEFSFYRPLAELYAKTGVQDKILELAQGLRKRLEAGGRFGGGPGGPPGDTIHSALAGVYVAAQLYDEAVAVLKQGFFDTNDSSLIQALTQVYEATGETETAQQIREIIPPPAGPGGPGGMPRRVGVAPDIPLQDVSGKTIRLSEFPDKLILLNFFSHTSSESLKAMQVLEEFHQAYPNSLTVLGIAINGQSEDLGESIDAANITYPILRGSHAIRDVFEFAAGKPIGEGPTTFTIIGEGRLIHEKHDGLLSEAEVQSLIASTKNRRRDLDLEPNVLWANKVIEFSSEYSDSDWSAQQILGKPDTYPAHGDRPTAWASESEDGQTEFITVGYKTPTPITGIKIYETYNPGAIERIEVIDDTGAAHLLWQKPAERFPHGKRIFRIDVQPTQYKVEAIRIQLDSQHIPGWNQIDAVGLIYPHD